MVYGSLWLARLAALSAVDKTAAEFVSLDRTDVCEDEVADFVDNVIDTKNYYVMQL